MSKIYPKTFQDPIRGVLQMVSEHEVTTLVPSYGLTWQDKVLKFYREEQLVNTRS